MLLDPDVASLDSRLVLSQRHRLSTADELLHPADLLGLLAIFVATFLYYLDLETALLAVVTFAFTHFVAAYHHSSLADGSAGVVVRREGSPSPAAT
jgi:hypothetical protein